MLVASALLASAVFALASSLDHELSTLKAKLQAAEFLNIRRGPWTGAPWVGMGLAEAVNDDKADQDKRAECGDAVAHREGGREVAGAQPCAQRLPTQTR